MQGQPKCSALFDWLVWVYTGYCNALGRTRAPKHLSQLNSISFRTPAVFSKIFDIGAHEIINGFTACNLVVNFTQINS